MEGDLASLKIHRRQLKSCLTRTEKFLDKSEASLQPEQIKVRHEKFAYCYDEFNRIQSKIEEIDETELDTNEREDFEERYFDFEARFRKMISLTLNNANQTATQSSVSKMIKLPTIDLPRFSGNYEDWMSFYDIFNSLIHKDKHLPLVQKFHYLKSCLKGDAASILHSLEISADNYNNAWQMLQDRYSNQRVIVQKHINSIFELPTAVKENLKTLRQILDGVLKHTRALAALKRPTQYWDDLLVVIITKKLDHTTYKEWESKIKSAELPTFEELISFLTQKCQTLEAISNPQTSIHKAYTNVSATKFTTDKWLRQPTCTYCKGKHWISTCKEFANMTAHQRQGAARKNQLCINCLKENHTAKECRASTCKYCKKRHHYLLHFNNQSEPNRATTSEVQGSATVSHHSSNTVNTQVMLSTAIVHLLDDKGRKHSCRALLDCGSQSNLITKKMANKLGIRQTQTNITLTGVTACKSRINNAVNVSLLSRHYGFKALINCLILEQISEPLPLVSIPRDGIRIPSNIKLADPDFHVSRDIDLLIGIELYCKLLSRGRIELGTNGPWVHKTLLGWIVAGRIAIPEENTLNNTYSHVTTLQELNKNVSKFWEIETIPEKPIYTQEERHCEQHFERTAERDSQGRFIVALPFKENVLTLGKSYEQAEKRFQSLERKLNRNPTSIL